MKTPNADLDAADVDVFVEALRGDLPSAGDEARVRARLCGAGVVVTGAALTTSASGALTTSAPGALGPSAVLTAVPSGVAMTGAAGGVGAGAPLALAKAGLLSKVLLLPAAAKLGATATLVVAAATTLPLVLDNDAPSPAPSSAREAAPAAAPASPGVSAAPAASASEPAGIAYARDSAPAATPARVPQAASAPLVVERLPSASAARRPANAVSDARGMAPALGPRKKQPTAPGHDEARGRAEPARASTLGDEARLIEQAMLALGAGDADAARRFLEEHARRFPGGALERERERALARLQQPARREVSTP